jgi:transposase
LFKKIGLKWKRYRKSLSAERDEVMFRFFQGELKELEQLSEEGLIDLLYFDGSGFNLNPNVPYGWLKIGQKVQLPALRGQGYTVLASLNVKEEKITEALLLKGAANADCIIYFFDTLVQKIDKKTIVILDNASIHKAKIVQAKLQEWRTKGLFLQFIPPYCPELNKIEIFWKQMKHQWLHVIDYSSLDSLERAIFRCIQQFGSIYRILFT